MLQNKKMCAKITQTWIDKAEFSNSGSETRFSHKASWEGLCWKNKMQKELSAICRLSTLGMFRNISSTGIQMIPWRCLLSGGNGGGEKNSDGQATHPLPQLPLLLPSYKAFLRASQAWCVCTAVGAYSWHQRFMRNPANKSRGERQRQMRCTVSPSVVLAGGPVL